MKQPIFTATLPMTPTVNHYRKQRVITPKGGKKPIVQDYPSSEAKAYKNFVVNAHLQAIAYPHPIEMVLTVCFATNAAQDLDNRVKGLQDALGSKNGGANVYLDDSQIKRLVVERGENWKGERGTIWGNGCVMVEIYRYENPAS